MGLSQKSLADKIRTEVTTRLALVILGLGALAAVAGGISNWKTVTEFFQGPAIKAFSVPADQREEEIVWELALSATFPLGWEVEVSEDEDHVRQAGDEYMTFSVGTLQEIDADTLPEARESQVEKPLVRNKEVDALIPSAGQLTPSSAKGFLFEYDASDGSDRKRLEVVASHNGKAVFARCAIVKRALDAYRAGCMELLDNITLLPSGENAPVLNFTTETAQARIWHSTPQVFDESYDYLVSNWKNYNPEAPHKVDRGKIPDNPLTSEQVVDQASTLAGRPTYFTAMVDAAERLHANEGGGMRWVLQLTSNSRPGWRFYVQVNAPAESQFSRGDFAVVLDAVLVAGGATLTTDGGLNNSFYFLAPEVITVPSELLK